MASHRNEEQEKLLAASGLTEEQKEQVRQNSRDLTLELQFLSVAIDLRRQMGASRPAVFAALGTYFFGELEYIREKLGNEGVERFRELAEREGKRLYALAQKEKAEASLRPTQAAAAA